MKLLPSGWREGVLQDLVVLQRGYDITKAEQVPGDVPVVSSSGITSYHNLAKAHGPGVVIGRKGSLGTVHYVEGPYWPHDTTLWSRDLRGNNARFVYYFLRTLGLERFDVGNSNPTLNRNHIHGLPIAIPDAERQQRIAGVLSRYDDLIDVHSRRIRLLERTARTVYKEWFVNRRFPGSEGVEIRGGLPVGWAIKSAADVLDALSGGTPKTNVVDYWDGDVPFFTPRDATDHVYVFETERYLTEDGLRHCNSRLYPRGTIFITARGTVGKMNIAQTGMAMNQSCYALVAKPPADQTFLYFALSDAIDHIRSRAHGAVFDAIVCETFEHIPLVVPDERTIRAFSEFCAPMLEQMDVLLTLIRRLVEGRDLLLPRLMSGEAET